MELYGYSVKTGEYIGTFDSETFQANQHETILTTNQKPLEVTKEHLCNVFKNGTWSLVADYRGITFCRVDSNGVYISPYRCELGETPDGTMIDTYPPDSPSLMKPKWDGTKWTEGADLESVKAAKIAEINAKAGAIINGGFYSYAEGKTDSSGAPVVLLYKSDADHREQLHAKHSCTIP